MYALIEEKSEDSKESICEELEQLFDHFPRYRMNSLLGELIAKLGGKDNFKRKIGN